MSKAKDKISRVGVFIACALLAWLAVGHIVFAIRHPWATDTERFFRTPSALMFESLEEEKAHGPEK